jgi:hypothetical protein
MHGPLKFSTEHLCNSGPSSLLPDFCQFTIPHNHHHDQYPPPLWQPMHQTQGLTSISHLSYGTSPSATSVTLRARRTSHISGLLRGIFRLCSEKRWRKSSWKNIYLRRGLSSSTVSCVIHLRLESFASFHISPALCDIPLHQHERYSIPLEGVQVLF